MTEQTPSPETPNPTSVANAYEAGRQEALGLPDCRPWDANLGAIGRALETIDHLPRAEYPWRAAGEHSYGHEIHLGVSDEPITLAEFARRFVAWMNQPSEAFLPRLNPWGQREPDELHPGRHWHEGPVPPPSEAQVMQEADALAKREYPKARRGSKAFKAALDEMRPTACRVLEAERATENQRRKQHATRAAESAREDAQGLARSAQALRTRTRHAAGFAAAAGISFTGAGALDAASQYEAWAKQLNERADAILASYHDDATAPRRDA